MRAKNRPEQKKIEEISTAVHIKSIINAKTGLWILTIALLTQTILLIINSAAKIPVNPDAGYYIPAARLVLAGKVPYFDFPSNYAPGSYYLFALLGESGLRSPLAFMVYNFTFHALNTVMIAAVVRRLGVSWCITGFVSAVYFGALTGLNMTSVVIEPFQVFFILCSIWLIAKTDRSGRIFLIAGVAAGASLLVKQQSLLWFPGLIVAISLPQAGSTQMVELNPRHWRWKFAALFCIGTGIPFSLFVLLNWVNPWEAFRHIVSFGGLDYAPNGFAHMKAFLISTPSGTLLLPGIALALWAVVRLHGSLLVGIGLCFLLSLATLYVRTFPQQLLPPLESYVQLILPFLILLVALAGKAATVHFSSEKLAIGIVVLALIPAIGSAQYGIQKIKKMPKDGVRLNRQIDIAQKIDKVIGDGLNVLVINAPWIYALTSAQAPLSDYVFVRELSNAYDVRLKAARYVIVGPGSIDTERASKWLTHKGFIKTKAFDKKYFLFEPKKFIKNKS